MPQKISASRLSGSGRPKPAAAPEGAAQLPASVPTPRLSKVSAQDSRFLTSPRGQRISHTEDSLKAGVCGLQVSRLYDEYGVVALAVAFRIVGNHATAEEVVQDAFLSAWRCAARYDPNRGSPRAWICAIVRNRAIDRLRSDAAGPNDCAAISVTAASGLSVLDEVLHRDEERRIARAIAELPACQRQVIELAYFGGYSQRQIATIMGAPLGTTKGRARAALRALTIAL
jgi:RNA polymerase sigma-70 factor, ECF subfamily